MKLFLPKLITFKSHKVYLIKGIPCKEKGLCFRTEEYKGYSYFTLKKQIAVTHIIISHFLHSFTVPVKSMDSLFFVF